MQQNATAAVALCCEPRWSSGLYSASPDPLAGFKGGRFVALRGGDREEGRRGDVDSDAIRSVASLSAAAAWNLSCPGLLA